MPPQEEINDQGVLIMEFNRILILILTLSLAALLAVPLSLAQEGTSAEQFAYEDLRAEYRDSREDYSYCSRQYDEAVESGDTSEIRYYRRQLDDIYDDLAELDDEVEELTDAVQDNSTIPGRSDLLDDLDDLEDNVGELQGRITDSIDDEDYSALLQLTDLPAEAEETAVEAVPAPQLVFVDLNRPAAEAAEGGSDSWSDTKLLLWLGLGIIIALALIIFLIVVFAA